ncbi:heterokaryon incompatibility protein-domain-containing protein [Coniochaeta sp. 2T2.1]|nr:heterokaryon incompatibility protein-domain-containing protein [Coniochaeta sp. 2T2.1]
MENAVRFRYEPLPVNNNERRSTRLLQLLPGLADEPINCSIANVNLCDNPGYEALSYCWGNTANTIRISCDKEFLDVTHNLHDALVTLRDKDKPRTLWIDAICIDQENLFERSQQVGSMRDIYKQSKKTLVWLGPETEDTAQAFELVPYLLRACKEAFQGNPRPIRLEPTIMMHPAVLQVCQRLRLFDAFIGLEQRPYFSRIWIIQELAVSQSNIALFWGKYRLSWEEYFAATFTFANLGFQEKSSRNSLGAFLHLIMAAVQLAASDPPLISLLDRYRRQDSTDPRDKVFALLGIAGSQDISSLGCKVDYDMTVVEVYTNLARSYIQRDDNLDVLGYVNSGARVAGLPSWVPDWTSQGVEKMPVNFRDRNLSGTYLNHQAGGKNDSVISISGDGMTLSAQGILLDQIARVSDVFDEPLDKGCCKAHVCEEVAELKERSTYIAGGTAMDALFITQLAGCPKPKYDKIRGRFQEFWEEAKSHRPRQQMSGSLTVSTPEGSRQRRINVVPVDCKQTGEVEALFLSSLLYLERRRFARTCKGYSGLVPAEAAPGNQIAIFKGGNYPLVLRAQEQRWKLVGESYVHGGMNGELLDESHWDEFAIV